MKWKNLNNRSLKKGLITIGWLITFGSIAMGKPASTFPDLLNKTKVAWHDSGTKTVLVFVSSVCPCFRNGVDVLKKQVELHKSSYRFVAIAGKAALKSKEYYKKLNLDMPILVDAKNTIAHKFKVESVSTVVILGADGSVLYRGGIVNEDGGPLLASALEEIQNTGKTQVPFNICTGCRMEGP